MAAEITTLAAVAPEPSQPRSAALLVSLAWIAVILLSAVFADVLPLASPTHMDFANASAPPGGVHLLGTDTNGRDLLARVAYGARVSVTVAVAAPLIGGVLGTALGLIAAFFGGWPRSVILGVLDSVLAFPSLVLAMGLAAVLGQSLRNVTLALAILSLPAFARIARAHALKLLDREFVLAARAAGAGNFYILAREILPNMVSPLVTYALTMMSVMIVAEGSLSFLGVGIPPPTPSWGSMIAEGRETLERTPWICLLPAMVMFATVLSLNLIGDAMRERNARHGGAP